MHRCLHVEESTSTNPVSSIELSNFLDRAEASKVLTFTLLSFYLYQKSIHNIIIDALLNTIAIQSTGNGETEPLLSVSDSQNHTSAIQPNVSILPLLSTN